VLIYTYLNPSYKEITSIEVLIMLIRSVLLTLLWYALFAPIVRKAFQKYLLSKKSLHIEKIDEILNLFPQFKNIVAYCWNESEKQKGLKRIKYFLSNSFYYLLLTK